MIKNRRKNTIIKSPKKENKNFNNWQKKDIKIEQT